MAFALWFGSAQIGFPEDTLLRLSQAEAPILDPVPEADRTRPERDDEDAAPRALESEPIAPVLEQKAADDLPANVRGNRTERKWRIIPFGRFRTIFDDNIFISHDNPESDVSFTVSPGIAAGWGDYGAEVRQLGEFEHYFEPLNLTYEDTPQSFAFAKYVANASLFLDHSDESALDHDALVAGRWESKKLSLGLRVHYQTLSGTDIDVGDRVKRQVITGFITSSYKLSEKTSIDLNILNSTYDYETGVDWDEWTLETWLAYQILPKTRVSIGSRAGITDIQGGQTETFEQVVGRVTYYASSKLALSLDGGIEWRQYGGDGHDDVFSVFNFAATYAPFDGTTISVNAFRKNAASASLINENITNTGVNVRTRQRFLHRYFLTLEGGYSNSEYRSILTGTAGGREDNTVYVKPAVSFDITKNLSAESAYQFQKNDSTVETYSFVENLITFQLNLQF